MYNVDVDKRNEIVKFWRQGAEEAIQNADAMLERGSFAYALFFGNLAIEKLLKSQVIEITDDHAPRTHDLLYLVGLAKIDLSKGQEKFLVEIGKFNVEGRYPEEKFAIGKLLDRETTIQYLSKIKTIFSWLSSARKEKY